MFNKLRCWLWALLQFPIAVNEARIEIQRVADYSAGLHALLLQLTAERSEEVARLKKEGQARHAALAMLVALEREGQGIIAGSFSYKHPHTDKEKWMTLVEHACNDVLPNTRVRLGSAFREGKRSAGEEAAFSATLRSLGEFLARVET